MTDRSHYYLKPGEVQTMLGISRTTLWRWTTERGLKVVRVGEVVRIRQADLDEFLSKHESGAVNGPPMAMNAECEKD